MRTLAALAMVVAFLLIVGYLSQNFAMGAVSSWTNYRNPFLSSVVKVERTSGGGEPLAKHVIIVLLDGLSQSALLYHMQNNETVRSFVSKTALYLDGKTVLPSFSYPTRGTILSGAPPEVHEVSSNFFSRKIEVDNLFKIAKERGYVTASVGDSGIHKVFGHLLDESYPMDRGGSQAAVALQEALELVERRTARGERLFLWIGLTDVDTMGHKAGPFTEEYNATLVNVIALLSTFVEALQERGVLKDTLLVVLNDHGFKKGAHHGGPEEEVTAFYMMIISPLAKPGTYRPSFDQKDVAPTISMIMGWPLPANSLGKPITEGLSLPAERGSKYALMASEQAARTLRALADGAGLDLAVVNGARSYEEVVGNLPSREIAWRTFLSLAIFAVVAAIALFSLYLSAQLEGNLGRALLLSLGLALIYEVSFWSFYSFLGRPFSLSDVYSFSGFLGQVRASVLFGALAMGLAAGVRELTPYRRGVVATASLVLTALAFVTLLSLVQPAFFNATYGPTITMPFPNWNYAFLYFLSLIREAFLTLLGLPVALGAAAALSLLSRFIVK
ncbi:MAG: alkaline phosphatase family protein [Acidilobaceae archaeon]|nr:alkaline phosphatase family protein [Acidilobaceae archaeon]